MEVVTVTMTVVATVVVLVATMTTDMADTIHMAAVAIPAMTMDTVVAVDAIMAVTMVAVMTIAMIMVTVAALVAVAVIGMLLVRNATLVEKTAVVVVKIVVVAIMTVTQIPQATTRLLHVKVGIPTTVAVDPTKAAERKDTVGRWFTRLCKRQEIWTWLGRRVKDGLFLALTLFFLKLQFFLCIPRHVHFCFVLGSGAKGYISTRPIISHVSSSLCVGEHHERKITALARLPCFGRTKTSPGILHHRSVSTLFTVLSSICAPP